MVADLIFTKVDSKIAQIETSGKLASVIVINAAAYKNMQQEMLMSDLSQSYGKVRSPHDLRSYKGLQVVTSHVVADVEVF